LAAVVRVRRAVVVLRAALAAGVRGAVPADVERVLVEPFARLAAAGLAAVEPVEVEVVVF
jgi:hypothetical protein